MYVGLKQPRGDGERYVTPARAAGKETSYDADPHKMQLTSTEKKYLRLFPSSLAIFPSIDLVIFCCSRAQ